MNILETRLRKLALFDIKGSKVMVTRQRENERSKKKTKPMEEK